MIQQSDGLRIPLTLALHVLLHLSSCVLLFCLLQQYELDVSRSYAEVHPSSLTAVDNMVAMEELSEAAILHNLRLRFDDNLIYTHISNILVSINPFKQLPIYSPAIMKEYRERLAKLEKVAPHVYSLADAAYANLRSESTDQSVIISGESGAGQSARARGALMFCVLACPCPTGC